MFRVVLFLTGIGFFNFGLAQKVLPFTLFIDGIPAAGVTVSIPSQNKKIISEPDGTVFFEMDEASTIKVLFSHVKIKDTALLIHARTSPKIFFASNTENLAEVTVTGVKRLIAKSASPVITELYTPQFLAKAAPAGLFEALNKVNGVKPQLNCNVCNTGDIHINGMEGPYTNVLIDGMPIVSGLSTVYGFMGIPLSMVERVEVIKGPASARFGAEAMAGTINIITKSPITAPEFSVDLRATSWNEWSLDAGYRLNAGKHSSLLGLNVFHYNERFDFNDDGFTDIPVQSRASLFNTWSFNRKSKKSFTTGGRLYFEDRWGGQTHWQKHMRGSDSIYAETIFTKRLELISAYDFNTSFPLKLQTSYNYHHQDAWYGDKRFDAIQHTAFAQVYTENKTGKKSALLTGISAKFQYYDDNTPATQNSNTLDKSLQPGLFIQYDLMEEKRYHFTAGLRSDYHSTHGLVLSPRAALKLHPFNHRHTIRINGGTGFRVVHIFSEDHAALSGARQVVIEGSLQPERSINGIINYEIDIAGSKQMFLIDAGAFYSYFQNKIIPDYDSDVTKIIYANSKGHAISKGVFLNAEWNLYNNLKFRSGITLMEVYSVEKNVHRQSVKLSQIHAPSASGTVLLSKTFNTVNPVSIDINAEWNGPMRLPVLPNDFRPEYSPWFMLLDFQLEKKWKKFEAYAGIKNILNFIPSDPIMRPFDPFDKNVNDPVSNPNNYVFDPSYNYASLQGRRFFAGIRFIIK